MANIEEANEIIADGSDADMTEMARCNSMKGKITRIRGRNQIMLIPKDPEDAKT
jgi:peptide chain release factor 1